MAFVDFTQARLSFEPVRKPSSPFARTAERGVSAGESTLDDLMPRSTWNIAEVDRVEGGFRLVQRFRRLIHYWSLALAGFLVATAAAFAFLF